MLSLASPNGHGLYTLTDADLEGKMSAAGENFEISGSKISKMWINAGFKKSANKR